MSEGITGIQASELSKYGPEKSSSSSSVSKDEFLKLLTYQLKAQNPLNPASNQEFAAQLAQFSQLEQLTDIRSLLEEQVQTNLLLTQTISNTALPGLLGKSAKALSDKVSYDGENNSKITFSLPYSAVSGEIIIRDEGGNVVRRIELSGQNLKSGEHSVEWDGEDSVGNKVASGIYKVEVNLKDNNGATFNADTYASGKIEAVRFKAEGTILVIAGLEIPLQNVTDILTDN
jgi:flagellar basal-body rod modification protein FlgD